MTKIGRKPTLDGINKAREQLAIAREQQRNLEWAMEKNLESITHTDIIAAFSIVSTARSIRAAELREQVFTNPFKKDYEYNRLTERMDELHKKIREKKILP